MVLNPQKDSNKLKDFCIGGKASNLQLLRKNGFRTPSWIVIPFEAFEIILSDTHSFENINRTEIPEAWIEQIHRDLPNSEYYAVRSSAEGEDSELQSWAGQFDSFLFVPKEQLAEKIKKVWNSINSKRAQTYLNNELKPKMAVVIQVMINAEVSGVAFGLNPVSGNRKQVVVNSVYGLGEGLVNGELNSDNYIVENNEFTSVIASKTKKAVRNKEGGISYQSVPDTLKDCASLSRDQLFEIQCILKKLYAITGKYQDIEFAIAENQLFFLQTRPITTHTSLSDSNDRYFIWDNSNIIESYPGLTSPLTFSFITKMYERVYIQLLELFGVNPKVITENSTVFSNMLGLFRGRVYYNLYAWYKVLSLLPGYSLNAEFMENMMGVKEKFELSDYHKPSKIRDIFNVIRMVFGFYVNIRRLPRNTKKFEIHFEEVMKKFRKQNINSLNATELLFMYRDLEGELLSKWKPPLVNDFFAMIYFGIVPKLTEKYLGEKNKNICNDLFYGANDIISVEPSKLINTIIKEINLDKDIKQLFQSSNPEEIWIQIQQNKDSKVSILIDNYIEKFGDRCVGELKLETKTFKQNPKGFIAIIKSHLTSSAEPNIVRNKDIRTNAEAIVNKSLRWKFVKKRIFWHVLNKARSLVTNRENLRFRRTQAYGLVREIFLALGKRFYAESILKLADDIFYLSQTEVFNYIEGKSLTTNLQTLVELRKNEYETFQNEEVPDERFKTFGIPYLGNKFKNNTKISSTDGSLKGIGCCAGIVKKEIKIVSDPEKAGALNGQILVTSSTDPGWVTLFSSISGIIVERGSLLSHSAIVSRELGIPCIVGVTGVLDKLKDGVIVEMDGETGVINILS